MSLLESVFYGFLTGLSDILPVSAQAHKMLLLALFGNETEPVILRLMVHIGIAAALYFSCHNHILRIIRAFKLSRVPKRSRRRPLDVSGLMDLRILETMLIPVIFGFIYYRKLASLVTVLSILSLVLLLNGVILYLPQFLPGSNKNSLNLSPLDSILMGLGAVVSLIPGVSCIGTVTSVGSVRGADRSFALSMALLLNMIVNIGFAVYDVIDIFNAGAGGLSFRVLMGYLLCAAAAFGGVVLGVAIMRKLAANKGFGMFACYCWGAALFTFILFLSV